MKQKTLIALMSMSVAPFFTLQAADMAADDSSKEVKKTDLVESGTYDGTAYRVDDEEMEVYLKTDDKKMLELYFKEDTKIMGDGVAVKFAEIDKGDNLRVTLERSGDSLKPLTVMIMDEESNESADKDGRAADETNESTR